MFLENARWRRLAQHRAPESAIFVQDHRSCDLNRSAHAIWESLRGHTDSLFVDIGSFFAKNRSSEGSGHARGSQSLTKELGSVAMKTARLPPPPCAVDASPAEVRAYAAEARVHAARKDLSATDWITSRLKGKSKIPTTPFAALKTVVFRAPNTLNIAQVRPYEILQAIGSAANLAPHEQQALTLKIQFHENVILMTSNEFTARKVAAVTTLSIQVRTHTVKA